MRTVITIMFTLIFIGANFLMAAPVDEQKIQELVSKMTLEEKIMQMSQRAAWGTDLDKRTSGVISGGLGSFLNAGTTNEWEVKNNFQKVAVEKSRLGIPLIYGRDVIHGYETIFPIPVGQSCSWNPDIIEQGARVAAIEASADGVHWTFAPMLDITRDPRWGRVAETLGEDPYLTSQLGAAMVRGFQGEDLSDPTSVVACAKHYVGYGAAVGGRDYNTTYIPERQLRNVFLPSFKAAVDAGVGTVMSAFNDINGIPASGNEFTLRTILRDEWNWDGFVVSDWNSVIEMVSHGVAQDQKEAALKAVKAGVDMEMVSESYEHHIKQLVADGKLDEKMLDEMVANILRIKFRKGLFDNPYNDGKNRKAILSDGHKAVAKKAAVQSAVLLKNDGVLPLAAGKKIALLGPLADSPIDQMGTWSMDGVVDAVVTPKAAFAEAFGDNCIFAAGLAKSRTMDKDGFADAVAAAEKADVVVLVLGEEEILSGEAKCRAFLNLPGAQEELVAAVAATGKPIVTVIMAGRPLTFQNVTAQSNAVMFWFHPGTMGGPALVDLVTGTTSPSGKLSITFPRTVGQIPIYYSHRNTGRPASPNAMNAPMGTPLDPQGYTSKYLDVDITPEYPFGYGLTYTTFNYADLALSADTMPVDGKITVSAKITNTGKVEATEIAQLYIQDLYGSVTRPVKELKGFTRVSLKPGESKVVKFDLDAQKCGFHALENKYVVEPGDFKVWVSWNSDKGLEGKFKITE